MGKKITDNEKQHVDLLLTKQNPMFSLEKKQKIKIIKNNSFLN